jgi:hypothetical protein
MQKIALASKMSKDLEKNWLSEIEEVNLHNIFSPIYRLNHSISVCNAIVVYIIHAYTNESPWLNLKQDRWDNKVKILSRLVEDIKKPIFDRLLKNDDEEINEVIASYLEDQATWKFRSVVDHLEYHSRTMRFVRQKTDSEKKEDVMGKDGKETLTIEVNQDLVGKINIQKGQLLEKATEAREKADKLIEELNKEFVMLNHVVLSDFNFNILDEKKIDPYSWSQWIRHRVLPAKQKQKSQ